MKKFLLLFVVILLSYGCEIEKARYSTAYVYTNPPTSVLTNSATLGGIVIGEGGKDVSEYGIVWSTKATPTINDTKVVRGSRLGTFSDSYSGFQPLTTYYCAAYAVNEEGVGYGDVYSFKTSGVAPCNPVQDNFVNFGSVSLAFSGCTVDNPYALDHDGNIRFTTTTDYSTASIIVEFNESNMNYPKTGTYTVVDPDTFGGPNSILSTGEAQLKIQNYNNTYPFGAVAAVGTTFYVKNENNVMTIIFCDTPVGSSILNGKFSKATN